jgi:anion transporter
MGGCLAYKVPLSAVAGGYASSAVWVLIPALFFGFALVKSGLGRRIAYYVLSLFQPSYATICLSWFIIGLLLSALTPSITVRLSIVMPIAMSVVEACKIPERSKGSALIGLVAWGTALLPGTAWLTGSLWGIFMMGFYPPEIKSVVTFDSWLAYMAFPWFLITILFLVLVFLALKPKEPLEVSSHTFKKQYEELGKMSSQELLVAVILTSTLILFTTEKWHGISTPAVALLSFMALMLSGIITFQDITTGVNWDIINFFGVVIGLSAIFMNTGISAWLRPVIEPAIVSYASQPIVFLLVITVGFWIIRFVDVPWGFSTIAIAAPVFIPLYKDFGLHPALVSVAVIAAGNSFFLPYQQPFIMMGDAMSKSRGWNSSHVSIAGVMYAISVIAAILLSSFYWRAMGLIP